MCSSMSLFRRKPPDHSEGAQDFYHQAARERGGPSSELAPVPWLARTAHRCTGVEMWNSVMLCWWVLHGIQLAAGAVHGNVPMEDTELLRAVKESAFLSDTGKGSFSRREPERIGGIADEEVMMDSTGLYDEEEDVSEAVQLQTRAVRSPRRCFRHQESCLGHQLPCCDPCDTCYCRFFNAICYCRRISQACLHGRH